jgi:hypothetical protein
MSARCHFPDCGGFVAYGCMGCMREADDWPDGLHEPRPPLKRPVGRPPEYGDEGAKRRGTDAERMRRYRRRVMLRSQ